MLVDLRDLDAPAHAPAPVEPAGEPAPDGPVMRDKTLVIRLTESERALLHESARTAGVGRTAAWARRLLLAADGSRQEASEASGVSELSRFRGQLARIGNNLNQLTRSVNVAQAQGGGLVWQEIAHELRGLTQETRRLREAIEAAGR